MSRDIYEYPRRLTHKTRALKRGVDKWRRKKIQLPILILGTGRCGTRFMAKVLQMCGLDVQHELCGEHGTSSHFFHSDFHWYPYLPWYPDRAHYGERRDDYEFKHVIHMVRNPLTCIPSIAKIFQALEWEFMEDLGYDVMGKGKILRCMKMYYWINMAVEPQIAHPSTHRFKIERIQFDWKKLPFHSEFNLPMKPPREKPINVGSGYRRSQPTTWKELKKIDLDLANEIQRMAKRYGYV